MIGIDDDASLLLLLLLPLLLRGNVKSTCCVWAWPSKHCLIICLIQQTCL